MTKPPVIAIIGQGRMARAHARSWTNLGLGERIRYICTRRTGASPRWAPVARLVTDLDVVLSDADVGIVSICTPTPTHPQLAIRALRAGKHVLLEKPIALNLDQAQEIARVAAESPGMLMVAHVVRFFAGYELLLARARTGSVGRVLSVRARRAGPPGHEAVWQWDEAQSGGILVDFSIHDFDQLNLHLGVPVAATATPDRNTGLVETTVEYQGGGLGQVLSCLSMPEGTPFMSSIDLLGTAGVDGYSFSGEPTAGGLTGDALMDDPYTRQAAYFLRCVERTEPPGRCPVDDAISALRLSLAARESLATGGRVVLPPAPSY